MRLAYIILSAVALAVSSPVPASNAPLFSGPYPVVDLGYVKYKGITNPTLNITSWNGIRYAAAPEAELRWQPPVDIEKQNNYSAQTLDATQLGPACLQAEPLNAATYTLPSDQSEDCLLLNVLAPSSPASTRLPVMVQIHGGGYIQGNAQYFDGSYLVSQSRGGVIYVEIQYRLGGLGFLGGSAVTSSGTANAGLLDQRSALQWVQRHISAFGGDPDQVTIIGGSAGGGSVTAQLQIQGNTPNAPFHAAIAEFPWWQTYHNQTFADAQYERLLQTTTCSDLACLRALPFESLATAINATYTSAYEDGLYGYSDYYYTPYVDGNVIKELPTQAFAAGRFARVPMLTDHDALEGLIFVNTSVGSDARIREELQKLWPVATDAFLSDIDSLYPASDFNGSAYFDTPILSALAPNTSAGQFLEYENPGASKDYGTDPYYYKLGQIVGDAQVDCGTRFVAQMHVRFGVPVWKTLWNTGDLIHGSISAALLEPPAPDFEPEGYGEMLRAYYLSFVMSLDPNASPVFGDVERPYWPQYGGNASVLDWNATTVGVTTDVDESGRCEFLFNHTQIIRI